MAAVEASVQAAADDASSYVEQLVNLSKQTDKLSLYSKLIERLKDKSVLEDFVAKVRNYSSVIPLAVCTDVLGSSDVQHQQMALCLLGYLINDKTNVQTFPSGECSLMIKQICSIICGTKDKATCTRALWCMTKQAFPSDALTDELQTILNVLDHVKSQFQSSVTVDLEAINTIYRLRIQIPNAMKLNMLRWSKLVFPLLTHNALKVRQRAVFIIEKSVADDLFDVADDSMMKISNSLKAEMLPNLLRLMTLKQETHALKVWCLLVKILGKVLHHGSFINQMLPIVENGFKNPSAEIKIASFNCWRCLIENFAINQKILTDNKRVKLLMQVFRINNAKVESVALVKVKVWWYFIRRLGDKASHFFDAVLLPLLHFLFGTSAKSNVPITPSRKQSLAGGGIPTTPTTNPIIQNLGLGTPSTPKLNLSSLGGATSFKSIQKLGCEVIAHILCAPDAENNKSFEFTLEPLEASAIAGPTFFNKYGITLIHAVCESFRQEISDELMMYIWNSLVYHVRRVITDVPKPINVEVVVQFLVAFRNVLINDTLPTDIATNMFLAVSRLPNKALASPSYHVGNMLQTVPAQYLLHLLFESNLLLLCIVRDERFFVIFETLVKSGFIFQPLNFVENTLELVIQASDRIGNAEMLWRLWSCIVKHLHHHIQQGNQVNQGDALEHDFSCIYKALLFPIMHLRNDLPAPTLKTMVHSWTELYATFSHQAALVTNVDANGWCEGTCELILRDAVSSWSSPVTGDEERSKINLPFVETLTQMCHVMVENVDFSAFSMGQGQRSAHKSPRKLGAGRRSLKRLGSLHSLVALVGKLITSLHSDQHDPSAPLGGTTVAANIDKTTLSLLQSAAGHLVATLTILFSRVTNNYIAAQLVNHLTPQVALIYEHSLRKGPMKIYSNPLMQKLEKLWSDISACLQHRFNGVYDSELLKKVAPLLSITMLHPRRPIKNQSIILWGATFGKSTILEYPDVLKPVLMKVKEKSAIILPGWHAVELTVVEETPVSQCSQQTEASQVPMPDIVGIPSPTKISGSFLNKITSPGGAAKLMSPKQRARPEFLSPGGAVPVTSKRKLNLSVNELKDDEFVVIAPSPKRRRILTDHQKEVQRERAVCPALYNNLDASLSSQFIDNNTQNQSFAATPSPVDNLQIVFPPVSKLKQSSPPENDENDDKHRNAGNSEPVVVGAKQTKPGRRKSVQFADTIPAPTLFTDEESNIANFTPFSQYLSPKTDKTSHDDVEVVFTETTKNAADEISVEIDDDDRDESGLNSNCEVENFIDETSPAVNEQIDIVEQTDTAEQTDTVEQVDTAEQVDAVEQMDAVKQTDTAEQTDIVEQVDNSRQTDIAEVPDEVIIESTTTPRDETTEITNSNSSTDAADVEHDRAERETAAAPPNKKRRGRKRSKGNVFVITVTKNTSENASEKPSATDDTQDDGRVSETPHGLIPSSHEEVTPQRRSKRISTSQVQPADADESRKKLSLFARSLENAPLDEKSDSRRTTPRKHFIHVEETLSPFKKPPAVSETVDNNAVMVVEETQSPEKFLRKKSSSLEAMASPSARNLFEKILEAVNNDDSPPTTPPVADRELNTSLVCIPNTQEDLLSSFHDNNSDNNEGGDCCVPESQEISNLESGRRSPIVKLQKLTAKVLDYYNKKSSASAAAPGDDEDIVPPSPEKLSVRKRKRGRPPKNVKMSDISIASQESGVGLLSQTTHSACSKSQERSPSVTPEQEGGLTTTQEPRQGLSPSAAEEQSVTQGPSLSTQVAVVTHEGNSTATTNQQQSPSVNEERTQERHPSAPTPTHELCSSMNLQLTATATQANENFDGRQNSDQSEELTQEPSPMDPTRADEQKDEHPDATDNLDEVIEPNEQVVNRSQGFEIPPFKEPSLSGISPAQTSAGKASTTPQVGFCLSNLLPTPLQNDDGHSVEDVTDSVVILDEKEKVSGDDVVVNEVVEVSDTTLEEASTNKRPRRRRRSRLSSRNIASKRSPGFDVTDDERFENSAGASQSEPRAIEDHRLEINAEIHNDDDSKKIATSSRKSKNSSDSSCQNEADTKKDGPEMPSEVPTNDVSPKKNAAGKRKSKNSPESGGQNEPNAKKSDVGMSENPEISPRKNAVSRSRRNKNISSCGQKEPNAEGDESEISAMELPEISDSPNKIAAGRRKYRNSSDSSCQDEPNIKEDGSERRSEVATKGLKKNVAGRRKSKTSSGSQNEQKTKEDGSNIPSEAPTNDGSPKKMAARGRKRKNSSESGSQNEPNTREDGSEISSEVPTNVVSPTRNAAGRRKSKSGFGCTSCSASQKESHKIREGLEITVELPEISDSPKKVSGNRRKSKNNADNRKEDSGEIPVEVRENVASPKKNAGRKRKTKKASQSEDDTVEDGAEISAEMEENEARKKRNIRNVAGSQSEPESHEDEANVSADVPKDDGSPKKKVGSRKNNRNCSAGSNREESEIPLEMSRPGLKKGSRKRKSEIGSDDGRKEPESKEVAMNASRLDIAENAGKSPIHATETGKKKKRADSAESNADSEGGQKSRKLKVNDDNDDDGDEDSVRVEDAASDEKDKDRPGSKRIRKLIRTKRQRKTSLTSAENHLRRKRTNKTKEETDGDRSVENVKGKTFAEDIFNKKCNLDSDSDSDDEPSSSLKNNNNNANEEMMLSALRTGGHQNESGEKNSNFKTSDCTETKDEEIAMEIDDSAAQVGVDIVEDSGRNEVDKKDVENKDLIGESLSADAPSARDLSADDPSAHDPSADAPSADSPSAPSPAVQRNLRSRRIATSEQVLSLKQRHLRASKRSKYVRQIITKTVESALRRSPSNRRAMPLRITRSLSSSSGQRRGSDAAAVVKEDGVVTEAKKCVDADAAAAVETDATPATPPMTDVSETTEDPESETPRSVSKVPPNSRVLFTATTQQSSPVAKSLATRLLEQVRHRATKQTTDKQQTTKPTPRSFTDPPKPNRGLTKFHSRSGVVLIRDAAASSPSTTLQRMTHMRPPRRQLMISPARPEPIVVHSHVHSPTASPSGSILKKRPPCDSDEQEIPSPSDLSRRVSFNENVDVRKLLSSGRISPKPVNRCLEMPKQQTTPATTHPPSPLAATKRKTTTPDIDTAALQFSPILNKNKTEASAESESVPVPFLPGDNSCTADSGNQFSNDSLTAAASQLNSSQSVCPQLRDCTQPIDMILSDLTTSMWAVGLGHLFKSRQIRTIADFAALTELEIDALPLKTPKIATVRAVLATILAAWQRRDNNATDYDVTSHRETVEPAVQDSAIPAIAASPEKMLPSADAVIDTDSPLSKGNEDKINSSIEGELLLDTSNTSVEQSDQSESAVTVQTEADAPKINESRASDSGFNSNLSTTQSVDSVCHQGAEGVSSLVDLIAKFSEEHSANDLSRLPSDQIFKLHADLLKLTSSAVVALQKKCASAEETS